MDERHDTPDGLVDRSAAARILSELAANDLFGAAAGPSGQRQLEFRGEEVTPARGSHLTTAQLNHVARWMAPCPPYLVTAAPERITWRDSRGIVNVAHTGPLGAVIPVVAREATLDLWAALEQNQRLAVRAADLEPAKRKVLAATTTDKLPIAIIRTGVEAAARTLVQHAILVAQTPWRTPLAFTRGLQDSGIFAAVANNWHWGLQASTYRRGIIPVSFLTFGDRVRYSTDAIANLRAMKQAQLTRARELADQAAAEGVPVAQLVDHSRDLMPASVGQYSLLRDAERPRCLGQHPHLVDGHRSTVLAQVVDAFADRFAALLDQVELAPSAVRRATTTGDAQVFEVPDMTCNHCIRTITRALAELGVETPDFDLVTKKVVAHFPTDEIRDQAFTAIRTHGYTVIPLN